MNRAQRRAFAAGKIKEEYLRLSLTPAEMELMEEALDAYQRDIKENLSGDPSPAEAWALDRAEAIREAMAKALIERTLPR